MGAKVSPVATKSQATETAAVVELLFVEAVENAKLMREAGMSLSRSQLDYQDNWMTVPLPAMDRRRRSKLLTPYGWFIVLSFVALAAGTVLGFAS